MRIDHIAYRVKDRKKTADFFIKTMNYRIKSESLNCISLEPSEKPEKEKIHWFIKTYVGESFKEDEINEKMFAEYHLPPEIFIYDGPEDSVVGKWVSKRDGIGGIYHIAYQVENLKKIIKDWGEHVEFEDPIVVSGSTQISTKPFELTGVVYKFVINHEPSPFRG